MTGSGGQIRAQRSGFRLFFIYLFNVDAGSQGHGRFVC